ncbi:MAG TPA: hypothetical protein VL404_00740 [Candidatus Eisenbacteria bacterium]|jgi:hypothetical protein|nr:hypothetical protein [Candidatus Eisenbacteria bacterium]
MSDFSKAARVVLVFALFLLFFRAAYFRTNGLLFRNSDFEWGDLSYWKAGNEAFRNQPTFGDNSWYRNRGNSGVVGNFWVGSCENRRSLRDPAGGVQGDGPLGVLLSDEFTIRRNRISFLIGGGDGTDKEGVSLEVEGQRVLFQPGAGSRLNNESMNRCVWDVSKWVGKKAHIAIWDASPGPWGHVNADDFRYA